MSKRKRSRGKRSPARNPAHREVSAKKSIPSKSSRARTTVFQSADFRDRVLPYLLLALAAFIAYANAWPDSLAGDDARFAVAERYASLGITDTWRFFVDDLWAVDGSSSGLYRPLLLLSIMADVHVYGNWAAGYHLSNILLHIMATLLVYGFVRYLLQLKKQGGEAPGLLALLAALLFAVHPINAEAVNSIFNRSEIMVAVGAVGGLWWFMKTWPVKPVKAWLGLACVYFIVLLCRESAVVLPGLAVVILWFYAPGNWKKRSLQCFPAVLLVLPLALYLGLRINALNKPEPKPQAGTPVAETVPAQSQGPELGKPAELESAPVQLAEPAIGQEAEPAGVVLPPVEQEADPVGTSDPPVTQEGESDKAGEDESGGAASWLNQVAQMVRVVNAKRLSYAPRLWAQGVKMMVWPHPLMFVHSRTEITLLASLLLHTLLLGLGVFALARGSPAPLAGLLFFYLAILPSSGVIGPNYLPVLAERFLYLPSVGLVLFLAASLRWPVTRLGRWPVVAAVVAVVLVLTPLTWARNAEWASDVALVEADYAHGGRGGLLFSALVEDNFRAGNHARAIEICTLHADRVGRNWAMAQSCGRTYVALRRYEEAETEFRKAIGGHHGASTIHMDLANVYIQQGRRAQAREQFEEAIRLEYRPFYRELMQGIMLMSLYPNDRGRLMEARVHLRKALEIEPQFAQARGYLDQLEARLRR